MQRSSPDVAVPTPASPPVSTDPPPARTHVRPAASWTATDWSLPRDVDPPDDPQPGERPAPTDPPTDPPTRP
jgi:hypothetical protein